MYIAALLIPESNLVEARTTVKKIECFKQRGILKIQAEFILARRSRSKQDRQCTCNLTLRRGTFMQPLLQCKSKVLHFQGLCL
jgi:hypothetical protein